MTNHSIIYISCLFNLWDPYKIINFSKKSIDLWRNEARLAGWTDEDGNLTKLGESVALKINRVASNNYKYNRKTLD